MSTKNLILQSEGGAVGLSSLWTLNPNIVTNEDGTNRTDVTVVFNSQSSFVIKDCVTGPTWMSDNPIYTFEGQSILFTGIEDDLYCDGFRDYFDQLGIYEVSHADENGRVDEFQWTFGF